MFVCFCGKEEPLSTISRGVISLAAVEISVEVSQNQHKHKPSSLYHCWACTQSMLCPTTEIVTHPYLLLLFSQ